MRKAFPAITLICLLAVSLAVAQKSGSASKPASKARTTRKVKPAAKPTPTPNPTPKVVFHTTAGDINCVLFKDKVPVTSNNFIGLATGTKDWTDPRDGKLKHHVPYYDGIIFHRVIPNFMIQGGDPTETGTGGPGYKFNDELFPDLLFDQPGRLAMANAGPNTNGSQFFITELPLPALDPCFEEGGCQRGPRHVDQGTGYTIFGQCDAAAVEIVKKVARVPTGPGNKPFEDVKIVTVDVQGFDRPSATAHKPAAKPRAKTKATPKKQ